MLPFFQRYSLPVALLFIGIASVRIVATYSELSVTYDEPGHFACGLEYLSQHVYQLESQHPPLTRAAVAIGPYLAGIRLDPSHNLYPQIPARDSQGRQALQSTGHPDRAIALARLGNLPFFWLASLLVYAWSLPALTAASLVIWMAASGALFHPDYLCYFNEFAPSEREDFAVDSDLDWGQDMKLAARLLRARGATVVATNLPDWWTMAAINGLPPCKPADNWKPSEGWTMIGPTLAKNANIPPPTMGGTDFESLVKAAQPRFVWWDRMTPTLRAGGLLLYYFPPGSPLLR